MIKYEVYVTEHYVDEVDSYSIGFIDEYELKAFKPFDKDIEPKRDEIPLSVTISVVKREMTSEEYDAMPAYTSK